MRQSRKRLDMRLYLGRLTITQLFRGRRLNVPPIHRNDRLPPNRLRLLLVFVTNGNHWQLH